LRCKRKSFRGSRKSNRYQKIGKKKKKKDFRKTYKNIM